MEPGNVYLIGGLLVAGWVLLETLLDYRKLGEFDENRQEVVIRGFANSIMYGAIWPTILILFVLGKLVANPKGA